MASLPALWHLGQQWLANGHLALALSIIWSLYLVLVGAWILLQRRAPVATIGWLLSMAVLPVVGLLVYFVFGPRRFRRQRLKRLRSRRKARMRRQSLAHLRDRAAQAPARLQQLVRLVSNATQLPLSTAQEVQLLGEVRERRGVHLVDQVDQHRRPVDVADAGGQLAQRLEAFVTGKDWWQRQRVSHWRHPSRSG